MACTALAHARLRSSSTGLQNSLRRPLGHCSRSRGVQGAAWRCCGVAGTLHTLSVANVLFALPKLQWQLNGRLRTVSQAVGAQACS